MATTLQCTRCKHTLSRNQFYKDTRRPIPIQQPCIDCRHTLGWQATVRRRLEKVWHYAIERTEKACSLCRHTYPIEDFQSVKRTRPNPEGRGHLCKLCHNARVNQRYAEKVLADPETMRIQQAAKRNASPEKQRQYRRAWENRARDKCRAKTLRRRAKIANAFMEDVSPKLIFLRDKGVCSICGKKVKKSEVSVDHIVPLSKGGEHSYKNCALAHKQCNSKKNNKIVQQQLRLFG